MTRLLLCAALLASSTAFAAPRLKLAVLDVRGSGAVDPKTVAGLSELAASEAASRGLEVISRADLASLVGFEEQKLFLGCDDGSCLSELGGALGVDFVLSSQVSEVGGVYLVSLSLLDARKARALRRVTKRAAKLEALVDTFHSATDETFERAFLEAEFRARYGAPSGPPVGAIVMAGAGVLLLAGGIVAAVTGISNYEHAKEVAGRNDPTFATAKAAAAWQLPAADALTTTGLAALAGGGFWLFAGPGGGDGVSVGVRGAF